MPEYPVVYRVGREAASIIRVAFFHVPLFLFFCLEKEVAKDAFEFQWMRVIPACGGHP